MARGICAEGTQTATRRVNVSLSVEMNRVSGSRASPTESMYQRLNLSGCPLQTGLVRRAAYAAVSALKVASERATRSGLRVEHTAQNHLTHCTLCSASGMRLLSWVSCMLQRGGGLCCGRRPVAAEWTRMKGWRSTFPPRRSCDSSRHCVRFRGLTNRARSLF
jgi:hypothetical protein